MKALNREVGRLGESLAENFLRDKGFLIETKNFSNKFGEIDIIAKDKEILVFVEVKTKKGLEFGTPEEMVSKGKLSKIRNMAIIYMNGATVRCRIDVVAVVLSVENEVVRITHYENVY